MPPDDDVIVKIEEPDFYEENEEENTKPVLDDVDAALAEIDENLRIYGVKIWPHVCSTVKLKRSTDERRELYRKCTVLVLKRDPNVFDRSISKCLARRYVAYNLWAGSLTRYAVVIRNKLRPTHNSRTIPMTIIDDDYEKEGTSQTWPEVDFGGVFPHVDVGGENLSTFDKMFDEFVKQMHEAFLIDMPALKSDLLRSMILEAFKGKRSIRMIAKGRIEVRQLWKICNAVAAMLHAYNNRDNLENEEDAACVREVMNFCQKYCFSVA